MRLNRHKNVQRTPTITWGVGSNTDSKENTMKAKIIIFSGLTTLLIACSGGGALVVVDQEEHQSKV